jgi:hypothetical protein
VGFGVYPLQSAEKPVTEASAIIISPDNTAVPSIPSGYILHIHIAFPILSILVSLETPSPEAVIVVSTKINKNVVDMRRF